MSTESVPISARRLPLVMIEWCDSHSTDGWTPLTDEGEIEDRVLVCRSVGWLIHDGAVSKVIAPHMAESDQMCGVMTIPAVSVQKITVLALSKVVSQAPKPARTPKSIPRTGRGLRK